MQVVALPRRQCSPLIFYCPPIWLAPALARTASFASLKGAAAPLPPLRMGRTERRVKCLRKNFRPWDCKRHYSPFRFLSRRDRPLPTPKISHQLVDPAALHPSDEYLLPIILRQLENVGRKHGDPAFLDLVGLGDANESTTHKRFEEFWPWIVSGLQGTQTGTSALKGAPSLGVFRAEYVKDGIAGLKRQLQQTFQAFNANYAFSDHDMLSQAVIADLRYPTEWYPEARTVQRTIHLHVGPTNSGKTYHALKRLEQAESGVYAGPLRLLAHEVFSRLNAKGKACNLVTGDEQIMVEDGEKDATMYSCTVEMVGLNQTVDVAVIDEIQMMAHPERGWAWTQALLGLKAKELHVCGEARAVPIIKDLAAAIGDKLIIHNYERLNPLVAMPRALNGQLHLLRKGDAVVVFSKLGIHAMKKAIERATGKRVAIIYGGLPPEIRAQQARLFNDEDNDYDFLVASDAIGMGLNLNIKRVIFESIRKFNGSEKTVLPISEMKQIAGRAGRYKTAKDDRKIGQEASPASPLYEGLTPLAIDRQPGYVTCFDGRDLPAVKQALEADAPPITAVGIAPPDDILQRFADHFPPQTPYSYVMLRMYEFARINPRFFLCGVRDQMIIADALRPVKKLTTSDLMVFCASPANFTGESDKRFLQAMATCVAEQKENDILDMLGNELLVLDAEISPLPEYMAALEALHRNLVLYIWLSYRFGTFFRQRPLATHAKTLVEDNINQVLNKFTSVNVLDSRFKKMRIRSLLDRGQAEHEEDLEFIETPSNFHRAEPISEPTQAHSPTLNRSTDVGFGAREPAQQIVNLSQQSRASPPVDIVVNSPWPRKTLSRKLVRFHGSTPFEPSVKRDIALDSHAAKLKLAREATGSTSNHDNMAREPAQPVGIPGEGTKSVPENFHIETLLALYDIDPKKRYDSGVRQELLPSHIEALPAVDRENSSPSAKGTNVLSIRVRRLISYNGYKLLLRKHYAKKPGGGRIRIDGKAAPTPMSQKKGALTRGVLTPSGRAQKNRVPSEVARLGAAKALELETGRPRSSMASSQTTINILNSVISRAHSLGHRTVELRQ